MLKALKVLCLVEMLRDGKHLNTLRKTATAICGDRVLVKKKNASAPVWEYCGYSTDDKGKPKG